MRRRYDISHKKRAIWIPNLKVCTHSVRDALRGLGFEEIRKDNGASKNKYRNYYTFLLIRNPLEKVVSNYVYWKNREFIPKNVSFEEFIDIYLLGHLPRITERDIHKEVVNHLAFQYPLLNMFHLDTVVRYENLQEDWKEVQQAIGARDLPHINASGKGDWHKYYTPTTLQKVSDMYHMDMDILNYGRE